MLGKKLKQYREITKDTGETIANIAGIKRAYLSQIENEKKVPPFDTFIRIVKALASRSLITKENAKVILTDENYQAFLKKYYESEIGKKSKISESELREFFFNSFNANNYFDDNNKIDVFKDVFKIDVFIIIYATDEIRKAKDDWWYNYFLSDIVNYSFHTKEHITDNEWKILNQISSLRTNNTYTTNDTKAVNTLNELLDKKTVIVDLNSIVDKNMKLFLEGQSLTNSEMAMLKVALDAIKYNRLNK
ncbi:helix-turn-helix domain-containing protein [Lactococcus lactis]|uniref:helix-turn-helix domain-containing protein n=1 Tax=Lactococcus lactis TaxID=1358 RepID=UPI002078CF10|nr:helix-turn-helix transcriptional regulator [Lactococcus lactis]USI60605.1 helix-turn-helix domain-containing protein [Lactococcus lactis subsp. lactis]